MMMMIIHLLFAGSAMMNRKNSYDQGHFFINALLHIAEVEIRDIQFFIYITSPDGFQYNNLVL